MGTNSSQSCFSNQFTQKASPITVYGPIQGYTMRVYISHIRQTVLSTENIYMFIYLHKLPYVHMDIFWFVIYRLTKK